MLEQFDLVVLGLGSITFAAALRAAELAKTLYVRPGAVRQPYRVRF